MVTLNQLFLALLDLLRAQPIVIDQGLTSRRRTVELFLQEFRRTPLLANLHLALI